MSINTRPRPRSRGESGRDRSVTPSERRITITGYDAVRAAFHDPNLTRRFDRRSFVDGNSGEGTVSTAEGPLHRSRRRVENAQFRIEHLRRDEQVLMTAIFDDMVNRLVPGGQVDLCDIAPLLSVSVAARRAGLDHDGNDESQLAELVRCSNVFSMGLGPGILEAKNPDAIRATVLDTLESFGRDFVRPSMARRAALLEAGWQVADDSPLPDDLLTVLLQHRADPSLELDDGRIVRELATYLQGGTHSNAQTLMHTLDLLFVHAEQDPTILDRVLDDPAFASRCVQETLRLRPITPEVKRLAEAHTEIGNTPIPAGSLVILDVASANRDRAVYGRHADAFDPDRTLDGPVPRWGLSFSLGVHQCPGRISAVGLPVRSALDADPQHLYGTVTLLVREMLRRGAQRDPERPPVDDPDSHRAHSLISFPVIFPDTMASA